ncbi:hypothetical protein IQ238_29340 [Pleurocapsales cyanobacterium LEGE 06147]|nr:hypothetical protein [Pleurocapsales cyanobacterium LEGE 06147]
MLKLSRKLLLCFCAIEIVFLSNYYLKLIHNERASIGNYFKKNRFGILNQLKKGNKNHSKFFINKTGLTKNYSARKQKSGLEKIKFPLGWISRIEQLATPAKVAKEGMNILIPYTHNYGEDTIRTYLDAAEASDIKVLLEPYRESIKAGDIENLTNFVRTLEKHH